MKLLTLLFAGILSLFSCSQPETSQQEKESPDKDKPLNIILLIGDGMGLSQVSLTYYFDDDKSNFSRFRDIGLINTSSATHRITDSGAGATALATGERSYNGSIAVNTDSIPIPSIAEKLSEAGYMTGVLSTSQITHATPACYYAHMKLRNMETDIAAQLHSSPIDFFAGGGIKYFVRRDDGCNYLDSLSASGFEMDTIGLRKTMDYDVTKKYGYLLADDGMPQANEGRGDFLPVATQHALAYLGSSENNFFVMVEGSQIDWAGHGKDTEYMITEMKDFNKTIGVALDFAEKDGNTLVIVTADHETGGFALTAGGRFKDGGSDYNTITPEFAASGHSATLIPVFAYGPGSEAFKGIYNNNEIYHKLMKLAGK